MAILYILLVEYIHTSHLGLVLSATNFFQGSLPTNAYFFGGFINFFFFPINGITYFAVKSALNCLHFHLPIVAQASHFLGKF